MHGVETNIILADAISTGSAHGPKIDVAACDWLAFGRAGDRNGVTINVADVDVVGAGGAAFDLAVCGVDGFADIDTPCPASGVDDRYCCAERSFLWIAESAWRAGVVHVRD